VTSFSAGAHRGSELLLDITIASAGSFQIKDITIQVQGGDE
jgi:hypothetical protein